MSSSSVGRSLKEEGSGCRLLLDVVRFGLARADAWPYDGKDSNFGLVSIEDERRKESLLRRGNFMA